MQERLPWLIIIANNFIEQQGMHMEIVIETESTLPILTVSQLNREVRDILESAFPYIWIEGEISNFACPSSGHWYFSLKDAVASVRCAMFASRNRALKFQPESGMHVIAKAKVSLYEGRGEYQLIIESLEIAGFGALQKAFEQLKLKLANEGLFDITYKKPIPTLAKQIGVITSPTGAAIRDILSVLKRRFSSLPIIIYPTAVQGVEAGKQIVQALQIANERNECDVLIVARGGGSIEDLWPFNEEIVARAIFASKIPIISGVGHEIDITIADFVADHRAATPSAAAELVSPDRAEWLATLVKFGSRLNYLMQKYIEQKALQLDWLAQRLRDPQQQLIDQMQKLQQFEQRIIQAMRYALQEKQNKVIHLSQSLNAISPLSTLNRGYAIITRDLTGEIIRKSSQIDLNEKITARLAEGILHCKVESITP